MERKDKRKYDELRPVGIMNNYIPHAEGSALISIGKTRVICTATVKEDVPSFLKGSGRGWITAEYGMIPRSTQKRIDREAIKGKLSGRTHEIQRLIGRALRAVVDLSKLGERTILVDCDVIQADGGTRTASITGGFVALAKAVMNLEKNKIIKKGVISDHVAAISVGIVKGIKLLDLNYEEDFKAEVDMNIVMTEKGKLVEIQGTAEHNPFSQKEMISMLKLAKNGIKELIVKQKGSLR